MSQTRSGVPPGRRTEREPKPGGFGYRGGGRDRPEAYPTTVAAFRQDAEPSVNQSLAASATGGRDRPEAYPTTVAAFRQDADWVPSKAWRLRLPGGS